MSSSLTLPVTASGNRYALTLICNLSKFVVIIPIKTKSSDAIARAIFENFIANFGIMKQIRSDRGTEFVNDSLNKLCSLLNIKHSVSTAYYHESVGTIERNHRVFNEYVRAFVQKIDEWDTHVNYFTFCYNTTKCSSLGNRFSLFESVFGKLPNLNNVNFNTVEPLYNLENYALELKLRLQTAYAEAIEILNKMKFNNKQFYDENARPIHLKLGDSVSLKTEPYDKFKNVYSGPYTVESIREPNISINIENKLVEIHKNRVVKLG